MELVDCKEEYWEFVRTLRNDSRVNDGFIIKACITKQQQKKYMMKYSSFYKILLKNGSPVGYIGVINDDMRVCTHPDHQNNGLGTLMLKEMMKLFPTAIAKIKVENVPSINLFKKCGFKEKYVILEREEC
ncbi:MAG: hypothetical protein S4CHLAM6_01370 [Chlamydiae bacterium]|nr:hypothetical protein [Chlamydiota bacterium]